MMVYRRRMQRARSFPGTRSHMCLTLIMRATISLHRQPTASGIRRGSARRRPVSAQLLRHPHPDPLTWKTRRPGTPPRWQALGCTPAAQLNARSRLAQWHAQARRQALKPSQRPPRRPRAHRTRGAAHRAPTSAGSAAAAGPRGRPAAPGRPAAAAPPPARAGRQRPRAANSTPAPRSLCCTEPFARALPAGRLRGREAAWSRPKHMCLCRCEAGPGSPLTCAALRAAARKQRLLRDGHQQVASGVAEGLEVCGVRRLVGLLQPHVQQRRAVHVLPQAGQRSARRPGARNAGSGARGARTREAACRLLSRPLASPLSAASA